MNKINYSNLVCFYVTDEKGTCLDDCFFQEFGLSFNEFYTVSSASIIARKISKRYKIETRVIVCMNDIIFQNGKYVKE